MYDDIDYNNLSEMALEEMMDAFVDSVKDDIEEDEKKTTVMDFSQTRRFMFCYHVLRRIMKNKNVKVSYKMFEPFKTMGSITVEGSVIKFDSPKWFSRIAGFASNTEIYPLTKDAVRLTYTFHGLTTPIE